MTRRSSLWNNPFSFAGRMAAIGLVLALSAAPVGRADDKPDTGQRPVPQADPGQRVVLPTPGAGSGDDVKFTVTEAPSAGQRQGVWHDAVDRRGGRRDAARVHGGGRS